MKRTLFQTIIKESIEEGGNAVPSAQPVRGDLAGEIAKDVINAVSSTFNCEAEPAGSTGKKGREMTSGDIDILIGLPWERNEEVAKWVKENFPNCGMAVQPGFKQISFGYQYDEDGTPKVAQVDLMFTSNINWRRWSAYSPSPYESKFKGLVQTVLLKLIARSKPIDKEKFPDEFYTAEDYGGGYEGMVKSHWRYMWDAEIGLVIVHRTNEGKKRPIKSYTIKEDTIVVTSNPDEAMKLIFGPEATLDDMKSPETMVAFLFSGKYEYATPELLQRIHDGVMANKEMEKVPGALENFEALWNEYAGKEEPQGEPAYSSSISERLETLKLNLSDIRRIAKSLIRENVNNEMDAYHGTSANFDRFDPNFMGSGEGAQMYGWGIYVTTNQQTGEHYADVAAGTNGKDEKYLYAVDIPDDNGKNYLNIEGNSPQTYDAIASGLMKLRPDAKDNIEDCLNYCKENNTLMWLFQSQCDYAFGLKELSELLNKIGYDGVKVPVKYREAGLGEEGYNYTIFDANKVKIVNKNRL